MTTACPACRADGLQGFHLVEGVPTNSCLLLDDAESARTFPTGRLDLAFCGVCGFITNRAFEPTLAEYSSRYEETQSFSPRFVDFARGLASRWVERYALHGSRVLEVGCGKGEFLVWMVEAGVAGGVGIDPGVHPERLDGDAAARVEWIADFYDERYAALEFDALVCRHTLEHIHSVGDFLQMVRKNIGDADPVVLFELPDTARVLREVAFWDTYYEHCSYFSAGSLARLFRLSGFEVLDIHYDFDNQYLLLEARPNGSRSHNPLPIEEDVRTVAELVQHFQDSYRKVIAKWVKRLDSLRARGGRIALWGGGSKAVAFLSVPQLRDKVDVIVDINPHKQGRYIAGTEHEVVAPTVLTEVLPELVIVANPIYVAEVHQDLSDMGLTCELTSL